VEEEEEEEEDEEAEADDDADAWEEDWSCVKVALNDDEDLCRNKGYEFQPNDCI
jgi:hypothetical protein